MKAARSWPNPRRLLIGAGVLLAFAAGAIVEFSVSRPSLSGAVPQQLQDLADSGGDMLHELSAAAVRLPIAAMLGAALALRKRGRGAENGHPRVVQTQIVLAVVGALIMLVVGASLARAFGIVGVASLVRYRTKIADPKEAGVMLSALAVGLACGVGLYALATFSTAFLVATLWVIESFEPRTRVFDLSIKLGVKTAELRPRIEGVLDRFHAEHELRASSEAEALYHVTAPQEISTVRVTEALTSLLSGGKGSVEWTEKADAA